MKPLNIDLLVFRAVVETQKRNIRKAQTYYYITFIISFILFSYMAFSFSYILIPVFILSLIDLRKKFIEYKFAKAMLEFLLC
jgi:integral membrane sensor domain MASE1